MAFLAKVDKAGCGPEGRITKLDNLNTALRYLRLSDPEECPDLEAQARRMEESIATFKRTLRKFKYKRVEQRLEELSETPLDLEEVTQVVDNPLMWREFEQVIDMIKSEKDVEPRQLELCTTAVATLLLFKSWQRPGAVCTTTVRPDGEVPPASLVWGGGALKNLTQRVNSLGKRYHINIPTATKARKIGATTVALKCREADTTLICRQLSHSGLTGHRHYEGIVGPVHAARAFKTMEGLRGSADVGGEKEAVKKE